MTAKEAVLDILKYAPADVTFEELQYRIFIREKMERGLRAIEEGDFVTSEEMEAELNRWTIG